MFYEFQKMSTSDPSQRTNILVSAASILKIDSNVFENRGPRGDVAYTRVDLIGYPKYTFYTPSTTDQVLSIIKAVDLRNGFQEGVNDKYIFYPLEQYELIRAQAIFNNTLTEVDDYVFNPNQLIYAEETKFNDTAGGQSTALMIVIRDHAPQRILTRLAYNDLIKLLNPKKIPF